jgi:hypothetical protein
MSTGSQTDFRNGVKTFPRDSANTKVKTSAYTVLAADCIGSTIIYDGDATATITLPLIAGAVDGGIVTIVNNRPGQALTIDPNAADGINFGDQVVDGTTVVNTALTAQKGDFIKLATVGSASTYWSVVDIQGVWAVGA